MSDNSSAEAPETSEPASEDGRPRRRRRRRTRRRKPRQAQGGAQIDVEGYLQLNGNGRNLLLSAKNGFEPHQYDPVVPGRVAGPLHLETGLYVKAKATEGGPPRVTELVEIEGMEPEAYRAKALPFGDLISIDPEERYKLETETSIIEPRVTELIAPLGRGQRCLIVAPPKAGKTTLLQQMARAIATNHKDVEIFVLLIDERPEEVTDWKRSIVSGQVFASSTDMSIASHIRVSEMVLERARRLVELGRDVVLFMDSLTRMSRAYNNNQKGSGRILSGGIDARTMEKPRRFFGSARNAEHGGSLTIVATCLIDTGSRMDEVIFQEFKGTGNMEIVLDRKLFEKRIFPTINIPQSGTRKEEKLYTPEQVQKLHLMRRALSTLTPINAMELLIDKLRQFPDNATFLSSLNL